MKKDKISMIYDALIEKGFSDIHVFHKEGHVREFYTLYSVGFNAIAWKVVTDQKQCCLFQFKDVPPTHDQLADFRKVEKKCFCRCYWLECKRKNLVMYDINNCKGTDITPR